MAMTIRQLIAAGYEFQDTSSKSAVIELEQLHWIAVGYAAEVVYISPQGKWQLWVR